MADKANIVWKQLISSLLLFLVSLALILYMSYEQYTSKKGEVAEGVIIDTFRNGAKFCGYIFKIDNERYRVSKVFDTYKIGEKYQIRYIKGRRAAYFADSGNWYFYLIYALVFIFIYISIQTFIAALHGEDLYSKEKT